MLLTFESLDFLSIDDFLSILQYTIECLATGFLYGSHRLASFLLLHWQIMNQWSFRLRTLHIILNLNLHLVVLKQVTVYLNLMVDRVCLVQLFSSLPNQCKWLLVSLMCVMLCDIVGLKYRHLSMKCNKACLGFWIDVASAAFCMEECQLNWSHWGQS